MRPWPVREAHGYVWMWWGDANAADEPALPWLEPLVDTRLHYTTTVTEWPVHITRCVENQLDRSHLPFVHRTTIGKGLPRAVHVETAVDGDMIRCWSGQDSSGASLTFVGPGLWCLKITDRMVQQLAFVPVDEGRTRQYLRFYQGFVPQPTPGDVSTGTPAA